MKSCLKNSYIPSKTPSSDINDIVDITIQTTRKRGCNKSKIEYLNCPVAFDIESSSFYEGEQKRATMYAWVFGINGKFIVGRTWKEFLNALDYCIANYRLSVFKRMIVYVHNLSFEFQFFRNLFEWEEVFALEERKVVKACTKSGIEFRCSYILSNMSLASIGKNLIKYKAEKKVGALDYTKLRHTKTPLNDDEWEYIYNDCIVLMNYIQEQIEQHGNRIAEIPLTSTGEVRNLMKRACGGKEYYRMQNIIKDCVLSPEIYKRCMRAFTGGFTHANLKHVGKTLENVSSIDFTSSYPTVMISEQYPMGIPKFYIGDIPERRLDYTKCFIVTIHMTNVSPIFTEQYLSYSRCVVRGNHHENNGRIFSADEVECTVTNIDLEIIKRCYSYDTLDITEYIVWDKKQYLPYPFIKTILELYQKKTTLKGVEGSEVEYMCSKAHINSLYGMIVTNIARDEITYEDSEWSHESCNLDEVIDKYNNKNSRFLYYPWGVWVTAYARRNLWSGIFEFNNDYVYSDTDSIKCLNYEKHLDYINRYNKEITEKLTRTVSYYEQTRGGVSTDDLHPSTIKGVVKPLGIWDFEGKYSRFKTLGAKRYIVEHNGELEITIAGVGKKVGTEYLSQFKEPFKVFTDNLIIPKESTGKLTHTYIDEYVSGNLTDYRGITERYEEYSSVHLAEVEYSLSMNEQFINLIERSKDNSEIVRTIL